MDRGARETEPARERERVHQGREREIEVDSERLLDGGERGTARQGRASEHELDTGERALERDRRVEPMRRERAT